jgi:hypothetical protein
MNTSDSNHKKNDPYSTDVRKETVPVTNLFKCSDVRIAFAANNALEHNLRKRSSKQTNKQTNKQKTESVNKYEAIVVYTN